MVAGRIHFPGSPWPEGHAIEEFHWSAEVRDNDVWFLLHLRSQDYYAERDLIERDDDEYDAEYDDDESEWAVPIVWRNYHQCTISSTHWEHHGGFRICSLAEYSVEGLHDQTYSIDPLPLKEDYERHDLAFLAYIRGHDTVADHMITFHRRQAAQFDITWFGKIALTYSGFYDFRHSFTASILGVNAPQLKRSTTRE